MRYATLEDAKSAAGPGDLVGVRWQARCGAVGERRNGRGPRYIRRIVMVQRCGVCICVGREAGSPFPGHVTALHERVLVGKLLHDTMDGSRVAPALGWVHARLRPALKELDV
eukprot:CAMPEP_0181231410 /NCGR_PEP_ID=MMETSP1096-20121128/35085_1 /TAXON_ID=156174 ORGANISM="Chrysochromulina ericina, Strain CCMP281" /NCGR_SAMPLE_ID=MMETSP1096 /ASSEMBLY_ACC=CAM_ASM_000453 /LENGTH=111 /DNA_ID=CAMNT_0023325437 /DNA_START=14 /DNA_END=349 /DNA_ORIENTATION=-